MKKLNIGDSVKLNNYLTGVVEDYDDSYFFVKDTNGVVHKLVLDYSISHKPCDDRIKNNIIPKDFKDNFFIMENIIDIDEDDYIEPEDLHYYPWEYARYVIHKVIRCYNDKYNKIYSEPMENYYFDKYEDAEKALNELNKKTY